MARLMSRQPGNRAAPASRQAPWKVSFRSAKNANSPQIGAYTTARIAQQTNSPTVMVRAVRPRIAGAQAPHQGASTVRLKEMIQSPEYANRIYPNKEKIRTSV